MFPRYFPKKINQRKLLLLEGRNVYDKTGQRLTECDTLGDFSSLLFAQDGMGICKSFTDKKVFPFLSEAVVMHGSSVLCNKKGSALAVKFKPERSSRWLSSGKTWGYRHVEPCNLSDIENTFTHLGIGAYPTPGSLGMATMLHSWLTYGLRKHTMPGGWAEQFVRRYTIGGRVDTPGLGNYYEYLAELDMSSAYLSQYMVHPSGTAIPLVNGFVHSLVTYIAHCTVTIHKELALGPFPRRLPDRRITYPTLPGKYRVVLWKEQIEDCIEAGCTVSIQGGYGWSAYTADNNYWAWDIYQKRLDSPTEEVEAHVKAAIVAAIGRHGMGRLHRILVPHGKEAELDVPVCNTVDGRGEPLDFYVHEIIDPYAANMVHWYSYTLMQCARRLYHLALPYAKQGRLVATNYDSILVIEENECEMYLKRYSPEAKICKPGELRYQRLHNVKILAPRAIDCDEKTIRPGVPLEMR